jgi:hypothetical protein
MFFAFNITVLLPLIMIIGRPIGFKSIFKIFFFSILGMVLSVVVLKILPVFISTMANIFNNQLINTIGWIMITVFNIFLLFYLPIKKGLEIDDNEMLE